MFLSFCLFLRLTFFKSCWYTLCSKKPPTFASCSCDNHELNIISMCLSITYLVPSLFLTLFAVGGRPPRLPPPPASWQYLRTYSPDGTCFRHIGYLRHQQQVDLWPFDLESGVRVLLGLSGFELRRTYETDRRQTDVRQKHRLMPPPFGGGGIIK